MPTTDELQSQINALQSQLNSILGMADDDYIHQYSGEEIDAGITAAGKAVRYDTAQSLTTSQQKQARDNIGADAVQGAVRYDQAQSLTTAQQAQARSNIAAAPGGYGLGTYAEAIPDNADLNDYRLDGIYGSATTSTISSWANLPENWVPNEAVLSVAFLRQKYGIQKLYSVSSRTQACRACANNIWKPWEYLNPPLALGVEYRTTERYLGKPVYCKLVNCGEIAGDKTVAHGISSMSRCIFAQGNYLGAILPMIVNRSLSDTRTVYISSVSNTAITIICGANITGGTCYVQVKYTKTTD